MDDSEKGVRKDNGRHRSVRFDRWIHDEIESIATARNVSFTDVVNHLLEYQLNELGISKAQYDAKIFNLRRNKQTQEIRKQQLEIDRERSVEEAIKEAGLTDEEAEILREKSSKTNFMAFHPTLEADLIKRRQGETQIQPLEADQEHGLGANPVHGKKTG